MGGQSSSKAVELCGGERLIKDIMQEIKPKPESMNPGDKFERLKRKRFDFDVFWPLIVIVIVILGVFWYKLLVML